MPSYIPIYKTYDHNKFCEDLSILAKENAHRESWAK